MKKVLSLILAVVLTAALLPVSAFAADGEAARDIAIREANISGFLPPLVGSTPEYSYTLYIAEGEHYFILYQYWHDNTLGGDMFDEQTPFVADHTYSIGCILCPEEGYYFAEDCVFSFNGDPSLMDPEFLQTYYLFPDSYVVQTVAVAPVTSYEVPGDVDGDGEATAADALTVLRAAVGMIGLTDEEAGIADVNHDGTVNMTDALLILRFAMGLIQL